MVNSSATRPVTMFQSSRCMALWAAFSSAVTLSAFGWLTANSDFASLFFGGNPLTSNSIASGPLIPGLSCPSRWLKYGLATGDARDGGHYEGQRRLGHPSTRSPVPSLFRQTSISSGKQCEPTRKEIPAQRHDRRSRDRYQKFELYSCSSHEPTIDLHRTAMRGSLVGLACLVDVN